jgi:Tfp pilus assembly protein FimT
MLELLVVLALVGIVMLVCGFNVAAEQRRRDFENFARETMDLLEQCRLRAINSGVYAGAVVDQQGAAYTVSVYLDGNGNGIRTQDIAEGTDRLVRGPVALQRDQGDVEAGYLEQPVPQLPPKSGLIADTSDPVKFGRSDIISFSPRGDSSSGTLYLSCHSQKEMYALVLYGATARLTLWRLKSNQWQTVEDR